MGLIGWIVVGLIAGVLAKLLTPGPDPGGLIVTIVLGVVGALIGGFIVSFFGGAGVTGLDVRSVLVATLGAVVLLVAYRMIRRV